ncbi:acetyl-coenzyme A transferase nodX [Trichoderma asperellum]|uniref:Acetyl-coenzyme A transferase nodX n=1 Tax=Trichoderma asperellum TaxID=101201 RepID=A0A6V8R167_TRIAP|nr:CoA-transferase family III domain-containing protein [Trichoderma asperelloides]GFP58757.1 acetyl-coenzyme A transferase nodX [Trichoderma asperellum]
MATQARVEGVYGPGSFTDTAFTPVPVESKRLLVELAKKTPGFTTDQSLIDGVKFVGDELPCIPGPIKSQAFTAALHGLAGIIGQEILQLRGFTTSGETTINTDAAGMFPATPALVHVDGSDGPQLLKNPGVKVFDHGAVATPIKMRSQAIYPTATPGVWFQLHGSLGPEPILRSIGVDANATFASGDEAYEHIKKITQKYTASDLEQLMLNRGFPGSIVHSPAGWLDTMMGRSLARHPLINYNKVELTEAIPPVAFPTAQENPDARPLAGIKVLELARVIAAPACGTILAAMGADVIRVNSSRLPDFTPAQLTLMAGKRSIDLDVGKDEDRETLEALIADADVIIQGYRLGSLERRGFGKSLALKLAAARKRGVVYLDENCYGPDGYYAERPGWQQVADAAAGSSYVIGKAYGFPDGQGVLPSLPISDMSTGILSAVNVMSMLRDRARYGGSWCGCSSLTGYNAATLQPWVGLYQPDIVKRIQDRFQFEPMTSDLHVIELYYAIVQAWDEYAKRNGNSYTRNEEFYTHFNDSVYGGDLRILAPIVQYKNPVDNKSTPTWTSPPVPFCFNETAVFN